MIEFKQTLQGRYKMEAHTLDEDGNIVSSRVLADWFPNLITNQGMDFLGQGTNYENSCQVGTGSTAPAFTDTGLAVYLAGTSTTQSRTQVPGVAPDYFASLVIVFRFAAGVATGNLTEVGVGTANSGSVLFSRALILDGMGNPTTITVLPTEVLDVTYELRVYPPLGDIVGVVTISGINYNYTARASQVTSTKNGITYIGWGFLTTGISAGSSDGTITYYDGVLGPITGSPTGTNTSQGVAASVPAAYSAGSHLQNYTVTTDLVNGNLAGGISCIAHGAGWTYYQTQYTPKIPKTAANTLVLNYRHSWARH